jgi:hypothetical protein
MSVSVLPVSAAPESLLPVSVTLPPPREGVPRLASSAAQPVRATKERTSHFFMQPPAAIDINLEYLP